MRVRWSDDARQDRADIFDFIAEHNRAAAKRMDDLFDAAAERLAAFPLLGREGSVSGTREVIPHESYRLVYRVAGADLLILALVHTSRQWPPEAS